MLSLLWSSQWRNGEMLGRLRQFISGQRPREVTEALDREITDLQHEVTNSIHAVRSGHRLLQTMSGAIDLNRRRSH